MKRIKRDTTNDLFYAVLNLVKENGHYKNAEEIMDYVLPNKSESFLSGENIELSNYEFNFGASVQFGSNEGIYVDCFLYGKYTETELKKYNPGTQKVETETRRNIGTFKTLETDINSTKIMGELCGALIFYANQYINKNLDRYTPVAELEYHKRSKNCNLALTRFINRLSENMALKNNTVNCGECVGKSCTGKQDGCHNGIKRFVRNEINQHSYYSRNKSEKPHQYYDFLEGSLNLITDSFENYVKILKSNFADLSVYQAAGYVHAWLNTRKQNFIFYFANKEIEKGDRSYEDLNDYEKENAFKMVKEQIIKESIENDGDITAITDDTVNYYVKNCVYFYENGSLSFEY